MTKTQVEVITSVQRRRRWSRAEKERIVASAIEPGAVASEVARAAGIHVSQLFRWRQQFCAAAPAAPVFSPVAIAPGPGTVAALSMMQPAIEIEFATGARMRLMGPVDASTVKAMVIYTLIETAKLNDVDPQAWLADVLARLPDHPAKQIGDLLPWNWRSQGCTAEAA
jgi:transposase